VFNQALDPGEKVRRGSTMEWVATRVIVQAPAGMVADGEEVLLVTRHVLPPGVPFSAAQVEAIREAYVAIDPEDF
jgi:hypothetical protein